MNFKNLLASAGIVELTDEDKAVAAEAPVKTKQSATGLPAGIPGLSGITATPNTPTTTAIPVMTQGQADSDLTATYIGKLREKISAAEATALLAQFTSTMESLAVDIPEEGRRFRAALNVLKSAGVTSDRLTDAYNSLLGVLEAELQKFSAGMKQKQVSEIDAREQQVASINAQIEEKNKEVQALMDQRDGITTDAIGLKKKFGTASTSFEGAVATLQAEVNDSLQKLRIYFPATTAAKK